MIHFFRMQDLLSYRLSQRGFEKQDVSKADHDAKSLSFEANTLMEY